MPLELPHTPNCIVCGRGNPHGLHLSLQVDPQTGIVSTTFTPTSNHIGFEGIIHGGILATVLDEAMVWAATWQGKRFCVCAELTTRFKESAIVGQPLNITAQITESRRRLITTTAQITRADGNIIVTASGKYTPLPDDRNRQFIATLINDPATQPAASALTPPSAD